MAAALAEEAACDIVSEDEVLAQFSILVTHESGVICAAGDPFWPRFRAAYPSRAFESRLRRGGRGGVEVAWRMALLSSADAIMVSEKWVVYFMILYCNV
jgi:hypothetical protein